MVHRERRDILGNDDDFVDVHINFQYGSLKKQFQVAQTKRFNTDYLVPQRHSFFTIAKPLQMGNSRGSYKIMNQQRGIFGSLFYL